MTTDYCDFTSPYVLKYFDGHPTTFLRDRMTWHDIVIYYKVDTTQLVCPINWMRARGLRLNPTMTQVMWSGSSQQLKLITVNDIPVLSTQLKVVESARDLGVTLDSQLSLSYLQVATLSVRILPSPPIASSCTITYS